MKLGIYTNARRDMSFYDFLDYIEPMGIEMVEIGCGEESGFAHCSPETLMSDKAEFAKFTGALSSHHIGISALSCHGNPISPNKETADFSDKCMRNAVLLAEKLGLDTINCFSGCPGSGPEAKYINWITMSWPMDYAEAYEWQWNKVLVPYWKDFTSFAREHGVKHIALEMHPGQMCFNPKTVKRLRAEVGDEIGVNLDFSHLLWERMEPALVINELAGMIWHMHVKDVGFNDQLVKESGLVNFTYFDKPLERRWNFRSIGYGHGEGYWRQIFAELRRANYDYVASIEFECEVSSSSSGIVQSAETLKRVMLRDDINDETRWQNRAVSQRKNMNIKYNVDAH